MQEKLAEYCMLENGNTRGRVDGSVYAFAIMGGE